MQLKDQKGIAHLGLIIVMIVTLGFGFAVFNRVRQANDAKAERGSNSESSRDSSSDDSGVEASSHDVDDIDEPEDEIDDDSDEDEALEIEDEDEELETDEHQDEFEDLLADSDDDSDDEDDSRVKIEIKNGKLVLKIKSKTTGAEKSQEFELKTGRGLALVKSDQSIRLGMEDGKLLLQRGRSNALSQFPIELDPATNQLYVVTPQGKVALGLMPDTIISKAVGENILDDVTDAQISTHTEQKAVYRLKGTKQVKLFGLFSLNAPVEAEVGLSLNRPKLAAQPWYLDLFGLLFSR